MRSVSRAWCRTISPTRVANRSGAARWRETHPDHDDAGRPAVPGHPGILAAQGGVPVGPGIEGDRPKAGRPETRWTGDPPGALSNLRRRPLEEGLDHLADAIVMLVVGEHESLPTIGAGRAWTYWRRVVRQFGHRESPV
jgi:hypothetical protein